MMTKIVQTRYADAVSSGTIKHDPHQEEAARKLDHVLTDLVTQRARFFLWRKAVGGAYVFGSVGRGKTMLQNWFLDAAKHQGLRTRRVHFHAFMLELHRALHNMKARRVKGNHVHQLADAWAKNLDILCFDEFHVTDVADAMVLMPLFNRFFARRLTIMTTSNWPPDMLYTGGLQRARFVPFIDRLKKNLMLVDVSGQYDYRELKRAETAAWLFPLNGETADMFFTLFRDAVGYDPIETHEIHVGNIKAHRRTWTILRASKSVALLDMSRVLDQALGAADFLAVAERYPMLFLDNLPQFSVDTNEKAKRFMVLIDALYDKGVRLAVRCDVKPEKLYPRDGALQFEFNRTLSRLREMTAGAFATDTVTQNQTAD